MYKTISWISIITLSVAAVVTLNLTWLLMGLGLWFFFTIVDMCNDKTNFMTTDFDEIKTRGRRKRNLESEHFIYDFLYNQKRR